MAIKPRELNGQNISEMTKKQLSKQIIREFVKLQKNIRL